MTDLQSVADGYGIARSYIDVTNRLVEIPPENRVHTLELMGCPVHDEKALTAELARRKLEPFEEITDPVTVIRDGDYPCVRLYVDADVEDVTQFSCEITLEDGTVIRDQGMLSEAELAATDVAGGAPREIRRWRLPQDIPWGYHTIFFDLTRGGRRRRSIRAALIRTPLKAYVPEPMRDGRKVWGISTQLYSVRSRKNWGIGDFADLKNLLKGVAGTGGQFVGLNPLHAGYPANPDPYEVSPYSPSSRQWLNIAYISVPDVPEVAASPRAARIMADPEFKKELRRLRQESFVDYRGVIALKLKVLSAAYADSPLRGRNDERGRAFAAFMQEGGRSLECFAAYGAIQEQRYAAGEQAWGWPAFGPGWESFDAPKVRSWCQAHRDRIEFYAYLQFVAAGQLDEAYAAACAAGMLIGPYRDLAVGVNRGSCDVWGDADRVYRTEATIGAPPDPLGPFGQSWGLVPNDPYALRRAGYRPLIRLYQANMRSCGALRIDHAAGLNRLWWLREGEHADHGAYVANPMRDLMGIVALESHRNHCLIIAEDLGTIPQELRDCLKEAGAYSYKLFFGERAPDGGFIAPQNYEPQAMAALTTHDMPTFKGWWEGRDLDLAEGLGLYEHEFAEKQRHERTLSRQRMLDSLHGLGSVGSEVPRGAQDAQWSWALVRGVQLHMCRSACALYSSQLEDWIGVDAPVNVPGTFKEYPNWKRKLTRDLEDIFADAQVRELTGAMTAARND